MGLVCVVMFATPAAALPPDSDPAPRLVFDSGLLARLRTLAAGLRDEIVLCLTGSADGPMTVATGFVMPDPHLSEPDRASFGPCPDAAIAIWHNHPVEASYAPTGSAESTYRRPVADPGASPRDLCALSETDIRTAAREGLPFVVVAVGGDTWCWWTRAQVHALAASKAMRGDPVPGQIEFRVAQPGLSRSYQTP